MFFITFLLPFYYFINILYKKLNFLLCSYVNINGIY